MSSMLVQPRWTMHRRPNHLREHVSAVPPRLGVRQEKPKPTAKVVEGQFDPDDLARRLYVVLAEQKAYAERKQKRARGDPSSKRDGTDRSASKREGTDRTSSKREGTGRSSTNRLRDGTQQPPGEAKQPSTESAADFITGLWRSESTRSKQSPTTLSFTVPVVTTIPKPALSVTTHSKTAPSKTGPPATTHSKTAPSVTAHSVTSSDASAPKEYHHVPREAARQFTRTTTVENMRDSGGPVHQLSKRALKYHTEGPRAATGSAQATALSPAELTRALQHTQAQRDRVLDRNQFQRTRILEEAAQLDHAQHAHSPRKHTFQDEFARILPPNHPTTHTTTTTTDAPHARQNHHQHIRRNSTGNATDLLPTSSSPPPHPHPHARYSLISPDLLLDPLLEDPSSCTSPPPDELSRFPPPGRGASRIDWSQSDAEPHGRKRMLLLTPLLKKADSLWALRGRKGSRDEGSEGSVSGSNGGSGNGGGESVVASPTTPKGKGFFGRFKR